MAFVGFDYQNGAIYLTAFVFFIAIQYFLIYFNQLFSRLWAEIFEVREESGDICWARVSDDVVPVNITCIQDTPDTVFQITAYNRHVEKIFDVRLIQPGMFFLHGRRIDHFISNLINLLRPLLANY